MGWRDDVCTIAPPIAPPIREIKMSETRKHDITTAPISTLKTAPSRRTMLTGSGALLAGVTGFLAEMPSAAAAEPDAAIIRLCAEHIANRTAYNTRGGYLEPDDDPLWHAYEGTQTAVYDAKPQTIAGIIAKAKAAKEEAQNPSGENWEDCSAADWAWDIVNDLVRLSGAPELAQVAA
jgi:hypothetical protein